LDSRWTKLRGSHNWFPFFFVHLITTNRRLVMGGSLMFRFSKSDSKRQQHALNTIAAIKLA